MSEHVHQFAATKTQFYKISSCAFLGLTRKGEKNETTSTTSKVEKGTDHYLSRGGGGGEFGGYHLYHDKFYLIPL